MDARLSNCSSIAGFVPDASPDGAIVRCEVGAIGVATGPVESLVEIPGGAAGASGPGIGAGVRPEESVGPLVPIGVGGVIGASDEAAESAETAAGGAIGVVG